MKFDGSSILLGDVVHARVTPMHHKLSYRTFSILLDLENMEQVAGKCRLFSHNSWNVLSFFDQDHADAKHTNLADYARKLVKEKLSHSNIGKVYLMTYPRVFGYVFNPLSVYFCHAPDGECVALIYEVNNTFGGRISYVQSINDTHIDPAKKQLLVSPFNEKTGDYTFAAHQHENQLTIGVALRDQQTPILKTWYKAKHVEFNDMQIIRISLTRPLMTMKVMAAIHYEALKLWLKGLRPPKSFKAQ